MRKKCLKSRFLLRIGVVVIKTTQVLKVNVALTVIPYAEPRAMNNNIEGDKKIYTTPGP